MAKVKNVEAFCTVCNAVTKMEICTDNGALNNENKRWAKCKKCKQMFVIDPAECESQKNAKPSVKDIETENCAEYSPMKQFNIGDSIYHKTWNDYGKVIAKEISSNGQNTIRVEFQKMGNKKLLEAINN
ncbi:MAG: hypothetical protein ACM3SM_09105 [Bacteroidota bacterium]